MDYSLLGHTGHVVEVTVYGSELQNVAIFSPQWGPPLHKPMSAAQFAFPPLCHCCCPSAANLNQLWHLHKLVPRSRLLSCREGAAVPSHQSNNTSSNRSSISSSSLNMGSSSSKIREAPVPGRSRASSSVPRPSQI